jgi:sarcosine oxidase gamma subunit
MLDAGAFWPAPPEPDFRIEGRTFAAAPIPARLMMISGDWQAGLAAFAPGVEAEGPHTISDAAVRAVRLGHDRVLLVELDDPEPVDASGWNAGGFAATDVSEAFVLIGLAGPGALDVLARQSGVDLAGEAPQSGGGAQLVFGETRLAAWRHGPDDLILAVERSRVAGVVAVLTALAQIL